MTHNPELRRSPSDHALVVAWRRASSAGSKETTSWEADLARARAFLGHLGPWESKDPWPSPAVSPVVDEGRGGE